MSIATEVSTSTSSPSGAAPTAISAPIAFLRQNAHADLAARIDDGLEIQVNVENNGGDDNANGSTERWHNYRVPHDAATNANFDDYRLTFNFPRRVKCIGATGWNWRERRSLWVGFDFDSIVGHAVGLSPEALLRIQEAVYGLDYAEVRRSTGGAGLHLYVHVDVATRNHDEHAALGQFVLARMSKDCGHDLQADVDCAGGNMWIWHRKATPENGGLSLLKAATRKLDVTGWEAPVSTKSLKVTDDWDALCSAYPRVSLDAKHEQIIATLEATGFATHWKGDYLETHTFALAKVHKQLGLHGVFETTSHGSDPDKPNCQAFPKYDGGWTLSRFGGAPDAPTWKQKGGKTTCDYNVATKSKGLVPIKASELVERFTVPRPDVVRGLIRQGDVVNIVGGSKSRKSFFVMLLALSIANGADFLGWKTVKGRVLLVDNELHPTDLSQRLKAMSAKTGLSLDGVDLLPLRGKLADLKTIRDTICGFDEPYALVVLDAWYKLLPAGVDENSNSDVTSMYVQLDETAEQSGSVMAVVHHTSKGSQSAKSVTDMGSGAGAQSRSADLHLVLRNHEEKDTVVLQAVVRAQAPVEPKCLVFEHPLWVVAPDKDPDRIALTNKRAVVTVAQFVETIPAKPEVKADVLAATKAKLRLTRSELSLLLKAAEQEGLVEVAKPASKKLPHTIQRTKVHG